MAFIMTIRFAGKKSVSDSVNGVNWLTANIGRCEYMCTFAITSRQGLGGQAGNVKFVWDGP
jgi:hypothetical protein